MTVHRPASQTPPMGWNSWDCFGTSVTEAEVMSNAQFMAERLLAHRWDTVVVDIQWYEPTARAGGYNDDAPLELDAYGRPAPVLARFPSSRDGAGFAPLASRVHDLGLRFGLHVMRGIPRRAVAADLPVLGTKWSAADVADVTSMCEWNSDNFGLNHDHPGAQAYYDSLFERFAAWGVDFVKVDDMIGPYHHREIDAFALALRTCGRDMVLSLSPGRELSLEHADHLRASADMWRVSDDLWDRWSDIYDQFERMARWAAEAGPGAWPDADMLPLGHIGIRAERGQDRQSRLTPDEQKTMMTLWCVSRSPLMFGGDLPTSDPAVVDLITNDAVLEVLLTSTGNRQVLRDGDLVVWTAAPQGPGRYVAVFNTGETPMRRDVLTAALGAGDARAGTDLWTGESLSPLTDRVPVDLPPHGAGLYLLD